MIDEWVQSVLIPILCGEGVSQGEVDQAGGIALLSADIDKIKKYVFESPRLPEIRGASTILDELNRGWTGNGRLNIRQIFSDKGLPVGAEEDPDSLSCIIYAGGGSLLALVPFVLAEEIKIEIEALYPRTTGTATITCVYQPIVADDLRRFDELMARQRLLLRKAKQEKQHQPFLEAIPPVRRCESCNFRPASELEMEPEPRWLCWPCKRKVEGSYGMETLWIQEFNEFISTLKTDRLVEIYFRGIDPADRGSIQVAKTIGEIAQVSGDEKSIGFIYADGNGVGRLVEESKTIGEYRRKSDCLHMAMRQAAFTALGRHLQVGRNILRKVTEGKYETVSAIHPFEIITIGGDDVLLIVPGDRALDVAITLGKTFEGKLSKCKEFADGQATLSIGMVIADQHNPVYFLHSLAEDLLKSAKKRARNLVKEGRSPLEGTLDFLVLKSQTMLFTDLHELRGHFPWTITSATPQEQNILTGRPFTWTEAGRLKRTAQVVGRGLPRSQLQALRQALRQGRLAGSMFYLYQWARADEWRKALLRWVEREWGVQAIQVPPPWIRLEPKSRCERYGTVWEDISEILELVPRLSDEEWQEIREQIQREIKAR